MEFSNPDYAWVGKVQNETTVGALKQANGLECVYSADLKEEQIAEINAQTVEAGEWGLISLKPFFSEETLIITMNNGYQYHINVTDAQVNDVEDLISGEKYILYVIHNGKYYALDQNGNTVQITNDLENVDGDYLWTYSLTEDGASWANGDNYLNVYNSMEENQLQQFNQGNVIWYLDNNYYNPIQPASSMYEPKVMM